MTETGTWATVRKVCAVAAVAVAIALVGSCSAGSEPAPTDGLGDPAPPAAAAPDAGTRVSAVVVRDGRVVAGGGDVEIRQGDKVAMQVATDVADEIHVHGYDILKPVEPGRPSTVEFTADAPGQYEVELEGARLQLARFQVR